MLVEIGLKACISVAHIQTWQGHASCLKKTQLVGSLEVPTSRIRLDDKQCVNECTDVDDVLQDIIASPHVGDDSESDDDDIQCQPVTNTEMRKSLSVLH